MLLELDLQDKCLLQCNVNLSSSMVWYNDKTTLIFHTTKIKCTSPSYNYVLKYCGDKKYESQVDSKLILDN